MIQFSAVGRNIKLDTQLVMSRHILNLEPGVFCLQTKTGVLTDEVRRWLGIQILPSPEFSWNVDILSFRSDGWLIDEEDIVSVRVRDEAAALYVIFFHCADEPNSRPHLDVRLLRALKKKIKSPQLASIQDKNAEPTGGITVHIENRGDVIAKFGEWVGDPSSENFIEGFLIEVPIGVEPRDLSYQALLGPGWASPWFSAGEFCGSRGMTLALVGLRIRLTGPSSQRYKLRYSASFSDRAVAGPVANDTACKSDLTAAMVALKVDLVPRER
jgi:hypothetical protein